MRGYFESLPIRYDVHYYSQVISCVYFFSPKENPSSLMAETSILFMYLAPHFVKPGPYKSLSYSK